MSEDSASGRLQAQVRETLARLSKTGELPSLPATATAALAAARDPDASIDAISTIVQTDIGIAARVLRIANSPAYARRVPCRTLRDAVGLIGLRAMQDVLVAASVRSLYGSSRTTTQLWHHALAVGLAAQELAPARGYAEPQAAFLVGLMHDVGRIAFFLSDPDASAVIGSLHQEGGTEFGELEREWFGFDHAEAGAVLASDWGLSVEACDAIRWHHAPESAGEGTALASLVDAADRIAYAIGFGAVGEPPPVDGPGFASGEDAACAERVREAFASQQSVYE